MQCKEQHLTICQGACWHLSLLKPFKSLIAKSHDAINHQIVHHYLACSNFQIYVKKAVWSCGIQDVLFFSFRHYSPFLHQFIDCQVDGSAEPHIAPSLPLTLLMVTLPAQLVESVCVRCVIDVLTTSGKHNDSLLSSRTSLSIAPSLWSALVGASM